MSNLAITNDIFRNSSGLMSELEAAISRGEVRRLERLGYIENAISPKGETWKLSKKGKASRDLLMGKRTFGTGFQISSIVRFLVLEQVYKK